MSALLKGVRYVGTTTGILHGERVFSDVTFIAARDQDPEPFVRGKVPPDQDRVFIEYEKFGSVPRLFVAGSIREAVSA